MMMKCLASGSDGNCYVLKDNEGKMLLIECGIPKKDILKGIGFNIADVVGAIVSHHHF